jgi:hypothetical protein
MGTEGVLLLGGGGGGLNDLAVGGFDLALRLGTISSGTDSKTTPTRIAAIPKSASQFLIGFVGWMF